MSDSRNSSPSKDIDGRVSEAISHKCPKCNHYIQAGSGTFITEYSLFLYYRDLINFKNYYSGSRRRSISSKVFCMHEMWHNLPVRKLSKS